MGKKYIKLKHVKVLDDFASTFEKTVIKADEMLTILNYDEMYEKDVQKAMNILKDKIKLLHNAKDEDDLNKIIKIKKVIKSANKSKSKGGWNSNGKS